ncbi:MAG: putative PEP-binding protein [Dehalococcoidia bacterium]
MEVEALKRVRAKYSNVGAMVPFVRTVSEVEGVISLLREQGLERGPDFKLWMMAELPTNILLLDRTGVDGVSIRSNDLTQFVLGVDRDNEQLAEMLNGRDPAVLQAIEHVVKTCAARGANVSICGQGPSVYPELTRKLVGWGITSVSVTPDMIQQTRQILHDAEIANVA